MITNFFAKAAATGSNQTQDGTGPVTPTPRSRVNKRTKNAKLTKGKTQQVEKSLQQIDKMFQIETRAPPASQPRAVLADRNEVINQGIGRSAGTRERPQVSPTRDHGKSEPMHVPYDPFYPEDQENWDWGFMIPSKPRPRSKYAGKSIAEDVANDEEAFFDWSSSPPRPRRREAEEGRESIYTQKRAPAEVETEQFADESSDGELSELDSDQFDSEFKDDEVVDSETDSETDSENERPEEYDNEWEDIEEEITIRIPGNSLSQAAVSMPFRQSNANNAPRVKQITATGMLGSAAEWAAILCWVAEFWDTDLEVVWDPFLRQSFGPLSCALAFQFADTEKAHRMEHHIAATTKKAMEKMLTVSRWILMSSPDVVPMNPMRNMFIECLTG
ncbi:hypothetical protein BO86DRAFT_458950 [Aspergillus japonicus CBS 114.51]|uniref:Uncharacterized protein n=1 Tax=Aspergillus japonicus CBS 114.51 TaxID=1448312 RepID=A0A8T8WPR3_ASPJA|nr:hypothetical protein BO86DRAFT_458950 [Aspergillus japonicus CBS 114.51]RAH77771.1 hypothetical protein BO86DRAFT_458950 [Aspergillus japonicus CBS 114.51]